MSIIKENLRAYRFQPDGAGLNKPGFRGLGAYPGREIQGSTISVSKNLGEEPFKPLTAVEVSQLLSDPSKDVNKKVEELYPTYEPMVHRYFLSRTRQPELAQDMTQEVFMRVLDRLAAYEDRGLPFGDWLIRIAHNLNTDRLRKNSRYTSVSLEELNSDLTADSKSGALLAQGEDRTDLQAGLLLLTEEQRAVLNLRFTEGLGIEKTAEALDKTAEAVKKLQARGLRSIKKSLYTNEELEELKAKKRQTTDVEKPVQVVNPVSREAKKVTAPQVPDSNEYRLIVEPDSNLNYQLIIDWEPDVFRKRADKPQGARRRSPLPRSTSDYKVIVEPEESEYRLIVVRE